MPELTAKRLFVSALLVLAVVGAHFLPGFSTSELLAELRNSVHIVGFAAIAGVLYSVIQAPVLLRVVIVLLIVATLGFLSEFAQAGFKSVDVDDLARDIAGGTIILVAVLLWSWARRFQRGAMVIRGLALVVALSLFVPLLYWSSIVASYARQSPVILDFDGAADHLLFKPINANVTFVDASAAGPDFSGQVLKAELQSRSWSGIVVQLPFTDWTDHRFLSMRVAMEGDTSTRIDVHLNDGVQLGYLTQHFIGRDATGPDPVVVRFPIEDRNVIPGRDPLDPSSIYEIYIIGKDREPGAVLYLDDIRLE